LCEFYFSDLQQSKNRPVLVFKDNLPHNDFIAIPISSKTQNMQDDEIIISDADFIDGTIPKNFKINVKKNIRGIQRCCSKKIWHT
jgi:mRNA interferase MazF